VQGLRVIVIDGTFAPQAVQAYRKIHAPNAAVCVSRSDRAGESWMLYRYDDHPAVDFSRLEGNSCVIFAHKGGFIAKLDANCSQVLALQLVNVAIRLENSNAEGADDTQ